MFGQKHHNGIAPYPNNAPPHSEEQYLPMDQILQRDLNARELAGIVRFILFLAVVVAVFLILVFGILGAVADAVGDALGLHQNYLDVVGRH
jgi:hypothetical protein